MAVASQYLRARGVLQGSAATPTSYCLIQLKEKVSQFFQFIVHGLDFGKAKFPVFAFQAYLHHQLTSFSGLGSRSPTSVSRGLQAKHFAIMIWLVNAIGVRQVYRLA